ncbi:hypothetical protein LEM8419_00351 [Neolewinella maritima]|uniref:Inactive Receiver domain-containing protein n=1 Tax=Neolewinella maritima TaxID=1383882 RepID=A0ABM9AXW0_9BACT|nr:hypothetical protein [Neolewinella maritima]CAH0999056.1 hypothetical protein LEM8419_00351 [Neolewinella maritima]
MIYIVDDKIKRAADYGWSIDKFEAAHNVQIINNLKHLSALSEEIFVDGNTICYHESFLAKTSLRDRALEKRKKLEQFAAENQSFSLVIFSGSKNSRHIQDNVAYLPVEVLYENLEAYACHAITENGDIRYLLFGTTPEREESARRARDNSDWDNVKKFSLVDIGNQGSLYIKPSSGAIPNIRFSGGGEVTIYSISSDEEIDNFVRTNLADKVFDQVFIPVAFGKTLCDYLGLRLAMHIRFTPGPNQLTPIFIYSFVGHADLIQNQCFDILKTKSVFLIDRDVEVVERYADGSVVYPPLSYQELISELEKVNLRIPSNYGSSHSMKNEWAVYRWAVATEIDVSSTGLSKAAQTNLYIKYYSYKHLADSNCGHEAKLKFDVRLQAIRDKRSSLSRTASVLVVDDEVGMGWDVVISSLFGKVNQLSVDFLGADFRQMTSSQIIEKVLSKVKSVSSQPDVVILDYYLSQQCHDQGTPISVDILQLIKTQVNPGIQVIVFSATNQLKNLRLMQRVEKGNQPKRRSFSPGAVVGIDGFVSKFNNDATTSALDMVSEMYDAADRALLLKAIYVKFKLIHGTDIPKLTKYFRDRLSSNLEVAYTLIEKSFEVPKYKNYAYLQLYLILEDVMNEESLYSGGVTHTVNGDIVVANQLDEYKPYNCEKALRWNRANKSCPAAYYTWETVEKDCHPISIDFRMSAVLLCLYGFDSTSQTDWPNIRDIRNERGAHASDATITVEDLNRLIDFMVFFFDLKNQAQISKRGLVNRQAKIREEELKHKQEKEYDAIRRKHRR